jgi:hypothetical protein
MFGTTTIMGRPRALRTPKGFNPNGLGTPKKALGVFALFTAYCTQNHLKGYSSVEDLCSFMAFEEGGNGFQAATQRPGLA